MRKISLFTLLVLLILPQLARSSGSAGSILLGTVQFPPSLKQDIEDINILYRGDPAPTQIDQTNKNITFSLTRESSQFTFKLLIAEPQSIEPKFLKSAYHTEATNIVAYQRIKAGHSYKYFMLTMVPEISNDGDRKKTYSWKVHEAQLHSSEQRIPDDTIIVHSVPEWVDGIVTAAGMNFPTIKMRKELVVESKQKFKQKLGEIALARLDQKPFEGHRQQLATKQVGNAIIIAAPLRRAAA